LQGLDIKYIKAHPENISNQAVHILLEEVTPGPCSKSDLPSSFIAKAITLREQAWIKELLTLTKQSDMFECINVFEERGKRGGDVGSALVLMQFGAALKICSIRLVKGELEMILPKHEKWREEVLNAFVWDSPFAFLSLGRS
jgi:hypothetical protein